LARCEWYQARRRGVEVVMTPELKQLLDEGLEDLDKARTTEDSSAPTGFDFFQGGPSFRGP
jgi:hypothetical protein